jgi:pyruvate dehydrogenase E2 component (dihydrolipoamide acetyltransferase)
MAKVPIYMPKFGMTMTEGLITEWLFAAGERVEKGKAIVLIETEKVQTELEAPETGILTDIVFNDNENAPVGDVIAWIETE